MSHVRFDAAFHTYTLGGRRLESVGAVVKRFKKPFDSDYWSAKVAARDGRTKDSVLAEWKAKSEAACDKGHELHAHVQSVLSGRPSTLKTPEASAWDGWWSNAREFLTVVGCEVVLHDAEAGIAGTCDLVARSSRSGKLHVLDWKTNSKFTTSNKYGEMLLPPFDDLEACQHNEYSLQVELYRMMAEDKHGEGFGDGFVVHLSDVVRAHKAVQLVDRWRELKKKGMTP